MGWRKVVLLVPERPHPPRPGMGGARSPGSPQPLPPEVSRRQGRGIRPSQHPPSRGGTGGRSGPVTCSDASPARSYRGAPGSQRPCFAAAAVPSNSTSAAASTISAAAMREIVHLQAGQCGNQIGAKVREGPGPERRSRDADRGPPSSAELLHHGSFGGRGPPGGQHPRDGGGGRGGQGQAGNKEAHGRSEEHTLNSSH